MRQLQVTLSTPAENLALDEALLEAAELAPGPTETLRLWESPQPVVVVGRSSRVDAEVNRGECERRNIPVLRRCSGGAAIVAGPGCLMYALVLSYELRPELRMLEQTHRLILAKLKQSLEKLSPDVEHRGVSDLVRGDRKFCGNSLRCKRRHLLYHGALLYDFPLELISACLNAPPRQPDYRRGRRHEQFVANFPSACLTLRRAVIAGWEAWEELPNWPGDLTRRLAAERYCNPQWNFRH
jgi:lipoate-protein ligase A